VALLVGSSLQSAPGRRPPSATTVTTSKSGAPAAPQKATVDWFYSYAPCCPDNPNYDAGHDGGDDDCSVDDDCDAPGLFSVLGQVSLEEVQARDLISFFDASDPKGNRFAERYAGRNVSVELGERRFTATIVDSCPDARCDGCCTAAARANGFAIEIEYYTALRHLGDVQLAANTTATWRLL